MSKDKWQGHDQFLLRNILEEDNIQSIKKEISNKRQFAFSAPPVLFDIGFKIDDGEIDSWDFDQPQSSIKEPTKKKNIKLEGQISLLYSPQITPQKIGTMPQIPTYNPFVLYPTNPNTYFNHLDSISQDLINNKSQICQWARDQHGSRSVQNILENGNDMSKQAIFEMVFKESKQLMRDRFGNYVFQKIFQRGLPQHRIFLLKSLKGQLVQLSEHAYGCRVVQKAIESISQDSQQQQDFIKQIDPHSLRLIQNQNGNHVIQKCFQVFPLQKVNSIVTQIIQELPKLAFHPYGCRVIQKYLQNATQGQRPKLVLSKLLDMAIQLSQCQYGNYVMQHIVSNCIDQQPRVLEIFSNNFVELSCNKYASNVIEKAIKFSPQGFKDELANWLSSSGNKNLIHLAKHQYANYVIQSLYEKLSQQPKNLMKFRLKENAQEITKSQYGRHVLMQLQRFR